MANRRKQWAKLGLLVLAAAVISGCGAVSGKEKAGSQKALESGSQGALESGSQGALESGSQEALESAARETEGGQPGSGEEDASAKTEERAVKMPAFTAKDLQGNEVTEEIFAGKDLTVLNIWGTFCPPCIREMPELGEWARAMPENVQLIGLITDIQGDEDKEHLDLALEITGKTGAEFTQIIANQDFYWLLSQVVGVPTTLFVDGEGNLVGDPIVGADVAGYKEFVEEYLKGLKE